jgi:ribA/ribD-fused uncharacterized protein
MITQFDGPHEFLSNFYPSEVYYEGCWYPTVEHAFQAAKTLDESVRKEISLLRTPGQAKRRGRLITLRPDWEFVKIGVMYGLVHFKFERTWSLRNKLAGTDRLPLIEGNTWDDRFWGMVWDYDRWRGKNWLGRILMKVRKELR